MLAERLGYAIFLDRDGVINENRVDHVKSWEEFLFLPRSIDAIVALGAVGCRIIVITNQAIINRGLVAAGVIDRIHAKLKHAVARAGGRIDDVYYCPHRPDEHCGCRKPQPGLLTAAARRYRLDLSRSYLVGDSFTDIAAGQSIGCQTILVRTGRGSNSVNSPEAVRFSGYGLADDLWQAAGLILSRERHHAAHGRVPRASHTFPFA